MKLVLRDLNIGRLLLLGVLWGLFEVFLGKQLKSWQPSLFAFVMPFVITVFIILAKNFVSDTGGILGMAVIAAVMKWFASGMILHGAFMAILLEAMLAELVFLILDFGFRAVVAIGVLFQLYDLFHPFLVNGNLCQTVRFVHFKEWFTRLFYDGQNLSNQYLLLLLIGIHFIVGLLAAVTAWLLLKIWRKS